ncbi:MAG: diguanylate cyclase [Bdellovibrionaceae bacterium]|nr:diguanylate cyclase [Pseudobdellovibrionaceae bacterium]
MSRDILFLEDGSVTARRLKRALTGLGRNCVSACQEQAAREHLLAGAGVILHVPSDPRKFMPFLSRLTVEFPNVPVLHITEEAQLAGMDWQKGPLHEWLGITATAETVLRRVDTLSHFADLQVRVSEFEDRAQRVDRFTRSIRSLDVDLVARQAIEILREELGATNVIWFPEDSIHKEIDQYFKTKGLGSVPRQPTRISWQSLVEFTHTDVEAMFDRWSLLTAVTGGLDAVELEMPGRESGAKDLLVPVRPNPARMASIGRPYGHLVFEGAETYGRLRGSVLLATYFDLLAQQFEEALEYKRLQAMTYRDDLTDLFNQRYLPVILDQELTRASRTEKEFSVLFCDVDFFKLVNDTKGHMVGSRVLVELSKLLKGSIRNTDFAFRYGGDEYVIVLSGANSKNAAQVAERLRQKAAATTFDVNGKEVKITVSIGVATYPEHARSTDEIMQMADEAMYYGKHKSRNVVYVAS